MREEELRQLAHRLAEVEGVRAVLLGGSRARGDHTPESDYDLGLYYQPPLDVSALQALARKMAGAHAQLTLPGAWGPWVDGGGWLRIHGAPVDWIYRDLDRVQRSWRNAQAGQFTFHAQVGHPLGFPDFAYAAEVALGIILADPTADLEALQRATRKYPPALADALVAALWEASFLVTVARKAAPRRDTAFVAGCLFRVVGLCAHALHGRGRRWVTTEKGLVATAGNLPLAPPTFTAHAQAVLAHVGSTTQQVIATIDAAEELVQATAAATKAEV